MRSMLESAPRPTSPAADGRDPGRRPSGQMSTKTVLCFGDSLTWGFDPRSETRYPFDQRWPGVLQGELGADVRVVEEAEISGIYDGELSVRKRLLIRSTGRVSGTVRYGEIEI